MSGIIRHHSVPFGFPWEAERDRGWVSPPLRNLGAPAGCHDGQIDALIAPSRRQMMSLIIRHHSTRRGVGRSLSASHDGVMRSRNDLGRVPPLPGFDRSAKPKPIASCPSAPPTDFWRRSPLQGHIGSGAYQCCRSFEEVLWSCGQITNRRCNSKTKPQPPLEV